MLRLITGLLLALVFSTGYTFVLTEYDPPVPAGIPTNATKSSECVAVNAYGTAACNSTYSWRIPGRYARYRSRYFAYTVTGGVIRYLPPISGVIPGTQGIVWTDAQVTSINDAGVIGGSSISPIGLYAQATLWAAEVASAVSYTKVTALSETQYIVDNKHLYDLATRTEIPVNYFSEVLDVNSVGDGVGMAANPSDPLEEQGFTKWRNYNPDDHRYIQ